MNPNKQNYPCAHRRFATTQEAYREQFQNVINVIEHSGGSFGHDPGI
jgi:hypothetical protein